jgi:hypothetical protein
MQGHILLEIEKSVDDGKKLNERTLAEQIDHSYQLVVKVAGYLRTNTGIPPDEKALLIDTQRELLQFLYRHSHTKSVKELNEFMLKKSKYGMVDPEYIPGYAPDLKTALQQDNVSLNNFYYMEENPSIEMLNSNKDKYNKSYIFIKEPPSLLYVTSTQDKKADELTVKPISLKIKDVSVYNKLLSDVKLTNDEPFQYSIPKDKVKQFMNIITENQGHTLKGRYNLKKLAKNASLLQAGKMMAVNAESKKKDIDHKTRMYTSNERAIARVNIHEGKFYNSEDKLMDTSKMVSHDKKGLAAFTINDHGELTVFNHYFMRDHDGDSKARGLTVDVAAHSSWNSGRAVVGAGEIKIENGKLTALTSHSGHYQPNLKNMYEVLKFFKQSGVNISSKIELQASHVENGVRKSDRFSADEIIDVFDKCKKKNDYTEHTINTGENKIKFLEEKLIEIEKKYGIKIDQYDDGIDRCKISLYKIKMANDENMKSIASGNFYDFIDATNEIYEEAEIFNEFLASTRKFLETTWNLEERKAIKQNEQEQQQKMELLQEEVVGKVLTAEEAKIFLPYEEEAVNQLGLLMHSECWHESSSFEQAKIKILELIMMDLPVTSKISEIQKEVEIISSPIITEVCEKIIGLLEAFDVIHLAKIGKVDPNNLLKDLEESTLNVTYREIKEENIEQKVNSQQEINIVEKFLINNSLSDNNRFFKSATSNSSLKQEQPLVEKNINSSSNRK